MEIQLCWLRDTGFVELDCYWKWLEALDTRHEGIDSTHHYEPHLHGTSGAANHHGAGLGFIAGSFYKFHQHKHNSQNR